MLDLTAIPDAFYQDPYPTYRALREAAPVCWQANGTVILSRFDDLRRVYRDTDRFISDKRAVFGPKYGVETPLYEHHTTSLVFNDPPLHTRVRAIMVGAMNPRALARMEPRIIALVDRLLDGLAAQDSPDLIEDFASAIPVEVIGTLFDIPQADRGPLRAWSLAILGALEPVLTPEQEARGNQAVRDFVAYLADLVRDRRARPGDPDLDVLTRLIQGQDGETLTPVELYQNCIFILNAGHETTTNLIANSLVLLDRHPEARHALISGGPWDAAIEEILRLESPNQFGNRLTTQAVTIQGQEIAAGTDLHLCIAAANRDPDAFPDPDAFRLDRRPNRHLAFGGGAHTCVGLTLARMEGKIALSRFLTRYPNYRIPTVPPRQRRIRFRGFARLPAQLGAPYSVSRSTGGRGRE